MKPALTLEAFADWCEKQPKRKEYDGSNPFICALAQFAQANGYNRASYSGVWDHDGVEHPVEGISPYPLADCLCAVPQTFGSLSRRLRTALSEAVQP